MTDDCVTAGCGAGVAAGCGARAAVLGVGCTVEEGRAVPESSDLPAGPAFFVATVPFRASAPATALAAAPVPPMSVPGGGSTSTMLWHLGHATIWPMADGSVTLSRALQVVQ